jgi:hypothetical protein
VGLANLGSESETCVGSRVYLVGVSISFEKNFYRLPFTPPSLVRHIGPSAGDAQTRAPGHQTRWDMNQNEARALGTLPRGLERRETRRRRRSGRRLVATGGAPMAAALCE